MFARRKLMNQENAGSPPRSFMGRPAMPTPDRPPMKMNPSLRMPLQRLDEPAIAKRSPVAASAAKSHTPIKSLTPKMEDAAPMQVGTRIARTVPAGYVTRSELYDYVTSGFVNEPNGTQQCFQDNLNRNVFLDYLVGGKIGSGSINGEAYRVCAPYVCSESEGCKCSDRHIDVAIKLIPIKPRLWDYLQRSTGASNIYNQKFLHNARPANRPNVKNGSSLYELPVELTAMTLANALVLQQICPNLPLLFHWFVCSRCNYQNPKLLEAKWRYGKQVPNSDGIATIEEAMLVRRDLKKPEFITPCAIVLNELASHGDLNQWCKNRNLSSGEAQSMMFQIFAGIYALRKYYDMHHNDLHLGNVLIHKLPHSTGAFKYLIDGREYTIPHHGWLFVLWDFGYATIVPKKGQTGPQMNAFDFEAFKPGYYPTDDTGDMRRVFTILYNALIDPKSNDKLPQNFSIPIADTMTLRDLSQYKSSLQEVFPVIFRQFEDLPITPDSVWDMDKPLEMFADSDLQRFVVNAPSEELNKTAPLDEREEINGFALDDEEF